MIATCIRKTEGLTVGKRYAVFGLVHFPSRLELYIIDDYHQEDPYPYPVHWDAQWFKVTGHMAGDLQVSYSYQSLSVTVSLTAFPPEVDEEHFYDDPGAADPEVFRQIRALEAMILSGGHSLG